MEVQGKIKLIGEVQTFGTDFTKRQLVVITEEQYPQLTIGKTDKPFLKRELVVVTEEQYPQTIMIEFVQDKCDLLNNYKDGQDVKVGINLRGREWINPEGKAKYFNSLQGWKIEKLESAPTENLPPVDQFQTENFVDHSTEPDDLPF